VAPGFAWSVSVFLVKVFWVFDYSVASLDDVQLVFMDVSCGLCLVIIQCCVWSLWNVHLLPVIGASVYVPEMFL